MPKIVNSVTELIGDTPLVRLNRLVPEGSAEIYVKLEYQNPGASVKDRIAISMIEEAEKQGRIKPGDTIVEPTSGNTGIGLAMVAAAKGYRAILVMPETMSIERRNLLRAYGAELVLTPGSEGMNGAVRKAEELVAQNPSWFMPQQFKNPANVKIHRETTGPEIVEAINSLDGKLDAFVAGVGTGGTISGAGEVLRKHFPHIKIYAVEPASSPVLSGGKPGPHRIQGIGAGFVPAVLERELLDEVIAISDDEAIDTAWLAARKSGVLCGLSAGAALAAAIEVGRRPEMRGKRIAVVLPDSGERYSSLAFFMPPSRR